jgi:hypothetical protein
MLLLPATVEGIRRIDLEDVEQDELDDLVNEVFDIFMEDSGNQAGTTGSDIRGALYGGTSTALHSHTRTQSPDGTTDTPDTRRTHRQRI